MEKQVCVHTWSPSTWSEMMSLNGPERIRCSSKWMNQNSALRLGILCVGGGKERKDLGGVGWRRDEVGDGEWADHGQKVLEEKV